MKRIIGILKKKGSTSSGTKNTLDLASFAEKARKRADELDNNAAACDAELKRIAIKIKKLPDGSLKTSLKKRAEGILQRKKKNEAQSEALKQQSFNLEMTVETAESAKDASTIVKTVKSGLKTIKKAQKKVDVDGIEDLLSELAEQFEGAEEIQEALGKTLIMPEIDEQELEQYLAELSEDLANDEDTTYLDMVAASSSNRRPISRGRNRGSSNGSDSNLIDLGSSSARISNEDILESALPLQ